MHRRAGRKITPNLEKEILAKAADGGSTRAIAAWLLAEHGVKVTHQAVAHLLRQTRQTRAEVAKVVVREQLSKSVISDLGRLEREQRRMERLSKRLHRLAIRSIDKVEQMSGNGPVAASVEELVHSVTQSEDVTPEQAALVVSAASDMADAAMKATDRVTKLSALKLKLSGANDEEKATDDAAADDELARKLDGLAKRLRSEPGRVAGAASERIGEGEVAQ